MDFPVFIHDYLSLSAKRSPDKKAIVCDGVSLSYSELDTASDRLANTLIDHGVQRQDKVIVFLDTGNEIVVALYGISKAFGVFVIINSTIKAKKLAYILNDSGGAVLITHTSKASIVDEALLETDKKYTIMWLGNESDIPAHLRSCSIPFDSLESETYDGDYYQMRLVQHTKKLHPLDIDLATLIYTSGSTGEPKGVMSSHQNIISAARSIISYLKNREDDIILVVLPLSFDYGLYQVLMAVMYGGTVILETSLLYIHPILECIVKQRVTGFPIVPTILAMILQLQNVARYDFDSLRYVTNTGQALPEAHIKQFRQLFPKVQFFSMFGLTECKRVSYLPPDELDTRPTSVGKAMPCCETFIYDETGNEVKPGEIGELVVRGANVMKGYWNAPLLTAQTFRPGLHCGETLLYTGDYFKKTEDGYLYFIGRKDDMIKSKGERVSPKEVENVLCNKKGVIEAAVIGVPDTIAGYIIQAFVVCDDKEPINECELLKYCNENLEPHAIPRSITIVSGLPKTHHGKIDKQTLLHLLTQKKLSAMNRMLG
ncbi:MAG: AMP-binding protein [Chitinivibrionales bacterium]|nr:AMP-binding protein [Chitinivibrionales bacterium]